MNICEFDVYETMEDDLYPGSCSSTGTWGSSGEESCFDKKKSRSINIQDHFKHKVARNPTIRDDFYVIDFNDKKSRLNCMSDNESDFPLKRRSNRKIQRRLITRFDDSFPNLDPFYIPSRLSYNSVLKIPRKSPCKSMYM